MIDVYLDDHRGSCKKQYGTSHFLLFLKNKYILIRYCQCNNIYGHLDYKEELIRRIIQSNKIYRYYDVVRERHELCEFINEKKIQSALKKKIKEINYIYYDNAWRCYAITTQTNFFDGVFDQDQRDISFEDSKKYLDDNGLNYLIKDLEKLHSANYLLKISDTQIIKSIDILLKEINQQLK